MTPTFLDMREREKGRKKKKMKVIKIINWVSHLTLSLLSSLG